MSKEITAGILVIGDEILSGRTKDKNIGYIAECLTTVGINLSEARVVPDDETRIISALNEMRNNYTYVLTTGGIGPTHDDITADCVAKAFGVEISENDEAIKMLLERIPAADLNESRRRMARIPHGAKLVENKVSKAPGFQLGNVFVMAGVPSIMQAMLDVIITRMETGTKLLSCTIKTNIKEGDIAPILRAIQEENHSVTIGSYPFYNDTGFGANVVCRGKDASVIKKVCNEIVARLSAYGKLEIDEEIK